MNELPQLLLLGKAFTSTVGIEMSDGMASPTSAPSLAAIYCKHSSSIFWFFVLHI